MALKKNTYFTYILLGIIAFILYGYSITFDFVWDDNILTVNNPIYSNFELIKILTSLGNGYEYLPVRDLTYVVDFFVWNKNPMGFHLSNVIYFAINLIVIYSFSKILLYWMKSNNILILEIETINRTSFLTTLLFAIFPLHCEVVCFITCRNVLISGLFFFVSCRYFIKFISTNNKNISIFFYTISLTTFILALLSKTTAIILPGILLLFVFFNKNKRLRFAIFTIPFLIISAFSIPFFHSVATESQIINNNSLIFGSDSIFSRISIAAQIPFFYIFKIFYPIKLSPEYIYTFSGEITNPVVVLSLIVIFAGFIFLLLKRKSYPIVLFAYCWFFIGLFPVMNFFATNPVVADRYIFIASYSFLFLFSFIFFSINSFSKTLKYLTIILILFCYSSISFIRSFVWKNDEILWKSTLKEFPETNKAYKNLASYYFENGQHEKCMDFLSNTMSESKDSALFYFYKGQYYFEKGKFLYAIDCFEKLKENPNYFKKYVSILSDAYVKSGMPFKALKLNNEIINNKMIVDPLIREHAKKTIKKLHNESTVFLDSINKITTKNPNDLNAIISIAIELDNKGFYNEAIYYYKFLENKGINNWILFFNMGNVFKKTNNPDLALKYYQKSIIINSDFPDTYNNIAILLKDKKEYDKSIEVLKNGLKLFPEHKESNYTLGQIYFITGDKANALKHFTLLTNHPEIQNEVMPYIEALNQL